MKHVARLAIVALLAGGGLAVGITQASASASACKVTHPTYNSVAGKCTGGSGEYRIIADCTVAKPGSDPIEFTRFGPWVSVGQTSKVTCGNIRPEGSIEHR